MQFVNSLSQIWHSDGVTPLVGTWRYLVWQFVRRWGRFPLDIAVGESRLHVREPSGIAALAYTMGAFDHHNMSLLRLELRPSDVFFDIGANIGIYTLIGSENPEVSVYALEPSSETFERLEENIRLNRRAHVHPRRLALSDHEGTTRLALARERETNRIDPQASGPFEEVRVSTIDAFCRDEGIRPTHIKLDVEGHELPVLRGLKGSATDLALMIVEGGEAPEKSAALRALGLAGPYYFDAPSRILRTAPQRRKEDPVFVRPERLRLARIEPPPGAD